MLALLWFAITNLLVPLIVWSTVFVLVAVVAGLPMSRWCVVRMRGRHADSALSGTHRGLLGAWIVVVLFVLPAGIALFNAVPFAASRGLAQIIERSEPETTQWVADLIAKHGAALGLDSEQIRSWTSYGSSALVDDFTTSLHLAAWGHVATAVVLLAACHVGTIALFRAALRPAKTTGDLQQRSDPQRLSE